MAEEVQVERVTPASLGWAQDGTMHGRRVWLRPDGTVFFPPPGWDGLVLAHGKPTNEAACDEPIQGS